MRQHLQKLEWTSAGSLRGREWAKLAAALQLNTTLRVLHLVGSPFSHSTESNYSPQLRDLAGVLERNSKCCVLCFGSCVCLCVFGVVDKSMHGE